MTRVASGLAIAIVDFEKERGFKKVYALTRDIAGLCRLVGKRVAAVPRSIRVTSHAG
jgi:hypothetical protein